MICRICLLGLALALAGTPASATPSFPLVAAGETCTLSYYSTCTPTVWTLQADGTFSDSGGRTGQWAALPATAQVGLRYDSGGWPSWPGALAGTVGPGGCIEGQAYASPGAPPNGTWLACLGPDSDGDGSPDARDCDPADPAIGGDIRVPEDHPTLAAAAAAAQPGDTVCVGPGSWTGAVSLPGGVLYGRAGSGSTEIFGSVSAAHVQGFTVHGDVGVDNWPDWAVAQDVVLPCGGVWGSDVKVIDSYIDACGGVGVDAYEYGWGISVIDSVITHASVAISAHPFYWGNGIGVWGSVLRDNDDVLRTDHSESHFRVRDSQLLGNRGVLFDGYWLWTLDVERSDLVGNRCTSIGVGDWNHNAFEDTTIAHHLTPGAALSYYSCRPPYSYPYGYLATSCFTYTHMGSNPGGDTSSYLNPFVAGVDGNIGGAPQFVRFSPMLPTTDWDLHLLSGSPLRDAGNPAFTDADGSRRDIGSLGSDTAYYEDSDGDGMFDGWELSVGLGLAALPGGDPDGDGLTNLQELAFGSWPTIADSDGDGASDAAESVAGTDPHDPLDTDWSLLPTDPGVQALLGCP